METKTILFADDDPEIREVLRLLLTSEGYAVMEAAGGDEVLERLDSSVDLVILDVMMPDLGGYAVCAEIRKRSAVPVLFLNAKGQDSDKTIGFSVGGDDYLVKPFSYIALTSQKFPPRTVCPGCHLKSKKKAGFAGVSVLANTGKFAYNKADPRRYAKRFRISALILYCKQSGPHFQQTNLQNKFGYSRPICTSGAFLAYPERAGSLGLLGRARNREEV